MATTNFSGPVVCPGGFIGNVTGNVTGTSSSGEETRTGAGAISTTTAVTKVVTTGANALTLAVPTVAGITKVITMTTDGGDGTLAMTNIVNCLGSEATSITFGDVADTVVLVAGAVGGKWYLIANKGATLA